MARIADVPEIQSLLEKALKKRRKVILVYFFSSLITSRALWILNSLKRSVVSAKRFLESDTSVLAVRSLSTAARYGTKRPSYHSIGLSDATLEV
jgi:hypothetical protein